MGQQKALKRKAWAEGGKLPDLSKSFFVKMAANIVHDVKNVHDNDVITYAGKEIILWQLALNVNGCRLKPKLQNVINKYRADFEAPRSTMTSYIVENLEVVD